MENGYLSRGRHQLKRGGDLSALRPVRIARGRLDQPSGPFQLRADITSPGEYPLTKAIEDVVADWWRQVEAGHVVDRTVKNHGSNMNALGRFAAVHNIVTVNGLTADVISRWMKAPYAKSASPFVPLTTQLNRRTSCSMFFSTAICLGIVDKSPVLAVPKQKKPARHRRPFLPNEIDDIKKASEKGKRGSKSAAAVALTLIGASAGECGYITGGDIDFGNMMVHAHGGGNQFDARWLPIDDTWAFEKLAERVAWMSEKWVDWQNHYVAYEPRETTEQTFDKRSAATSVTLTNVMKLAQVWVKGETRAASITEHLAERVFLETGDIAAVAARLGIKSLDRTAAIIGYDWQTEHKIQPPENPLPAWGDAS